jgi:hypothetical protein
VVAVNGRPVANWKLGPTRDTGEHRVLLPADAWRALEPLVVSFHVKIPRSPVELGWSTWDKRPLGLRLNSLRLVPAGPLNLTDGGNSIAFAGELPPRRSMIRRILGLPQFAVHVARILIKRYLR